MRNVNKNIELTILMPCLNEEKTIGICVKKAFQFLNDNNIVGEVLVINNGSTDNSYEIASMLGARVLTLTQKGYGCAISYGIKNALGKYIIMADADDSYNFLEILSFLTGLREGYDFVMGNRFLGKIEKGAMPFSHRYIGTPLITLFGNILYHSKLGDYNCGLRGFNRRKISKIYFNSTGMEFASEMIIKVTRNQFKIKEVPVNLYRDKRERKPHLNTIRDGLRHLSVLIIGVFIYDKESI